MLIGIEAIVLKRQLLNGRATIYVGGDSLCRSSIYKITLVIAAMLLASGAGCNTRRTSKADVEAMISDHLRDGAKVGEVTDFLDSRKIKHFGYEEGLEPIFAPTATQIRPESRRYILAKTPNLRETTLESWDLYIIFFFDERQTMTDYKMREIGTGP
jgi:hypothetical protein